MSDEVPQRMKLRDLQWLEEEWARFRVLAGVGTCPHCGFEPVRSEAGFRGFCPSCSGPVLAVA